MKKIFQGEGTIRVGVLINVIFALLYLLAFFLIYYLTKWFDCLGDYALLVQIVVTALSVVEVGWSLLIYANTKKITPLYLAYIFIMLNVISFLIVLVGYNKQYNDIAKEISNS
ncbi:hypothetical protein ASO20_02550 [Mycoplasma sp. (ex Biomphalaria glabrata)]|uniref:hypothetical protein n=1 Tax=Mycoplasma sp. (ex Biomphalaria glabrata) TaxID=1749074 RepID=UPI00073A815C|nr:hypothetical protein [Mycoplasma sp. (ex Biomphalaria glabrata)]ALV23515.1 hypothetical protein ASO20_02550 [Mycoplasma sp. (ex Biomphalaria glabrata)]